MSINKKINHFKKSIDIFFTQIERILSQENVGLSSFILICCLLDTASSYTVTHRSNKHNKIFKCFIRKYLSKVNPVYADNKIFKKIYEGIRCTLVHNFSIGRGILLGELNEKRLHLSFDVEGNLIIDLQSFYYDIKNCILKYLYPDLESNANIRKIFLIHYSKYEPFNIYESLTVYSGKTFTSTGHTISPQLKNYSIINYKSNHFVEPTAKLAVRWIKNICDHFKNLRSRFR